MARDVRSSLKRQVTYEKQFLHHPLLIMNGFSGDSRELQLTSSMFQNMFPSINVSKVKLNSIKRCVLLNRDEASGNVEFRHYTIKVVPVGLSKGVKKLAMGKIPNLGRFEDMSDFLSSQNPGVLTSDSEGEEDETSRVTLPQGISARGNLPQEQSSIRLVELGPRLSMKLIKIEEGLFDGDVLFHSLVSKTDEEKKAIRLAREKAKKEKEKRRKEQEGNVQKKERAKVDHKNKSLAGMQKKLKNMTDLPKAFEGQRASSTAHNEESEEEDDDAEYYRQEVGHAPEKDLFDSSQHRKRKSSFKDTRFKKKRKFGDDSGKKFDKKSPGGFKKFGDKSPKGGGKFGGKGKFGGEGKFGGGKKQFGERRGTRVGNFGGKKQKGGKAHGSTKAKFKVTMKSSKMNMKRKSKSK